ncbi:MAG: hypothetical protein ACJ78Q_17375, partial [Chloroflexia bacterium]
MHGLTRCARGSAALALLLCLLMVGIVVGKSQLQAGSVSPGPASRAFSAVNMASAPAAAAKDAQPVAPGGPVVGHDLRHDTSPPLSSMPAVRPGPAGNRVLPDRGELRQTVARPWVQDPVVQSSMSDASSPGMPSLRASFEGIYNYWGYYPPDTNGDVGPNHYVQIVNVGFQVFSKTGASLYGPANISTLFKGLGGVCETRDDGDPIALYDPLADRWLISQFAVPGGADGYHQCVAVSASGDPTGRYYRYDFLINNPLFNDYPHFGVWPDGYYVGFNMYGKVSFSGAEPAVLDRAAMLAGRQASFQSFPPQHGLSSLLPADFDGRLLPPSGEPEVFADVDLNGQPNLNLYNFHVDWAHPSNSTFTLAARLPVTDLNAPCTGSHYNCVSQPGTAQGLDSLGDRLMYRLQYRNFGDHQALVTNHTVDIGTSQAPNTGIRWYELRSPSGSPFTPSLYQQGTFAPDANNRWMGSVALDHSGNLAAGYSVSSQTVYPGLRYAGRLA